MKDALDFEAVTQAAPVAFPERGGMGPMNPLAIEITVLKKSAGVLSKRIAAAVDGSPVSDGSACRMSSGEAKRMPLPAGAQALADLIDNMAPNEALSLGRLVLGVAESVPVTTVSRLRSAPSAPEGTIARSRDFLEFIPDAPAFMLLDVDRKGMPQAVTERINAAGGVVSLLAELFPGLMKAARVERASTSAGIFNTSASTSLARSGRSGFALCLCRLTSLCIIQSCRSSWLCRHRRSSHRSWALRSRALALIGMRAFSTRSSLPCFSVCRIPPRSRMNKPSTPIIFWRTNGWLT